MIYPTKKEKITFSEIIKKIVFFAFFDILKTENNDSKKQPYSSEHHIDNSIDVFQKYIQHNKD